MRLNRNTIMANGRVVGYIKNKRFIKKAHASRHMLTSPRAWSLDVQSLSDAEKNGATTVEIHEQESGAVYKVAVARIWEKGFQLDRGFGVQIALPLRFWTVSEPGTRQLELSLC